MNVTDKSKSGAARPRVEKLELSKQAVHHKYAAAVDEEAD